MVKNKKINLSFCSKIYIAGHKGMVGSAFLDFFLNNGYTNLLYKSKSELDLLNQEKVFKFLYDEKPDYVIIAAARGVGGSEANNKFRGKFIYENLQIMANPNTWFFFSKC